jgi:hypothetical protein
MLHAYSVKEKVRAGEQPGEENPQIDFGRKNLLTPEVMKSEFTPLYGEVYFELCGL